MSISIIQSITNIEHTDIAYVAMTPDGFYLTSENRLSRSLCDALLLDNPNTFHQPYWECLNLDIIPIPLSAKCS